VVFPPDAPPQGDDRYRDQCDEKGRHAKEKHHFHRLYASLRNEHPGGNNRSNKEQPFDNAGQNKRPPFPAGREAHPSAAVLVKGGCQVGGDLIHSPVFDLVPVDHVDQFPILHQRKGG